MSQVQSSESKTPAQGSTKPWRRRLIITLIIIVALLPILKVIAVSILERHLLNYAMEYTGTKVTANLTVSLFSATVTLSDVKVANPEGFPEVPALTVDHAEVAIDWWPLFSQRVNIRNAELRNVALNCTNAGPNHEFNIMVILGNIDQASGGKLLNGFSLGNNAPKPKAINSKTASNLRSSPAAQLSKSLPLVKTAKVEAESKNQSTWQLSNELPVATITPIIANTTSKTKRDKDQWEIVLYRFAADQVAVTYSNNDIKLDLPIPDMLIETPEGFSPEFLAKEVLANFSLFTGFIR